MRYKWVWVKIKPFGTFWDKVVWIFLLFQRFFTQVEQVDAAVISLFLFVLTALDCNKDINNLENRKINFFRHFQLPRNANAALFSFPLNSKSDEQFYFFGDITNGCSKTHFFRLAHFLPSFLPVLSSGFFPSSSHICPFPFTLFSSLNRRNSCVKKKCVGAIRRLLPL